MTPQQAANPAGEVLIRIDPAQPLERRFTVRSLRPVTAAKVFVGRSLADTVDALPRLYNVCGGAQAVATLSACEMAGDLTPDPRTVAARSLLLRVEAIREHIWRILIDWPNALGLPSDPAPVATVMGIDRALRETLPGAFTLAGTLATIPTSPLESLRKIATEHVFGSATIAAIEDRIGALGWQSLGRAPTHPLPNVDLATWNACLRDDPHGQFAAEPTLNAQCCETGPLARRAGRGSPGDSTVGLPERWHARLHELASLLNDEFTLSHMAWCPKPGHGIATVEAARGTLIHRVEQRNGRVTRYQIVAPTEWNFHPRGVLSQSLAALDDTDPDTLMRQTRALVTAIDPCVAYRVEFVGDATDA
ncbi:MAG: nickel-dependent hydrogenase large subunit [Gammaproteobacteria bacterium]|nr:nickel-dependent hydrogenase large subunit [Gammaproteobacteria bacterium]MCP5135243.1 nickel-dependent hydrogenase large subunit [Gammaproteobacteria bacterium]